MFWLLGKEPFKPETCLTIEVRKYSTDMTNDMNDAEACVQELVQCHERFANMRAHDSSSSLQTLDLRRVRVDRLVPRNDIGSIPNIAHDFAREAAKSLSASEFASLLAFLKRPEGSRNESKGQLHKNLATRLDQFYESEVRESGQSRDRLARPGGPEDADLAIVLHLQSEEDAIGAFWNPSSPTIQLLREKGFDEQSVFGFDWHWRAEETFRGRTVCPTLRWTQGLRALHDQMSHQVLDILPLPFVITASSCARDGLRRTLGDEVKRMDIAVAPPIGILRFDLDFRSGFLKRIIVHVHHPTAGFFASKQSRPAMAEQIDAGMDLFLWLTGQKFHPNRFGHEYSLKRPVSTRKAPLAEMYAYVRREREERRLLPIAEYNPAFLGWVARFLRQDPQSIISRGDSIGAAAVEQVSQRISLARRNQESKRSTKGRFCIPSKIDNTLVESSGGEKNRLQQDRRDIPAVRLSDFFAPNQQADTPDGPLSIFTDTGPKIGWDTMKYKNNNVESRPNPSHHLAAQGHAARTIRPIGREAFNLIQTPRTALLDQTAHGDADEGSDDPSDGEPDEDVCAIEIPEPMDDRAPEDHSDDAAADLEIVSEVNRTDAYDLETFHGAGVVVQTNGTVKLVGHCEVNVLRFRMERKAAQDLMKLGTPSILFSINEIHLKIENEVVYRKPIERLLASAQGPRWLAQIHHEMAVMRNMRACYNDGIQAPAGFQQFLLQRSSVSNTAGTQWKNGELQRKLLQGSVMSCNLMKNGTDQGRVCVRGVQFLVPKDADFKTVSLRCEVAPEGTEHEKKCAISLKKDDPAYRLGVMVKYTSKQDQGTREMWAKLRGPRNAMKLNSLVDFLEGRDDDWTALRPRRFLDRCTTKGRMKPTYTS